MTVTNHLQNSHKTDLLTHVLTTPVQTLMPTHLPPTHFVKNLQLPSANIINKPMKLPPAFNNRPLDSRMLLQHLNRLLNIKLRHARRPRIVIWKSF
jgi:hypothetical protein